jgi:transketolase
MAAAERWLAARFNHPGHELVDHFTFVIASDGDLQEGISYEAASLAGHWRLGKLIVLYDDNGIQIDGPTEACCSENVRERFHAMNWRVLGPVPGDDVGAISAAIAYARQNADQPTLIDVKTTIGYGSPLAGRAETHGAPLGAASVAKTKENLGWPLEPAFHVPEEALAHARRAIERGAAAQAKWQVRFDHYAKTFPVLAKEFLAQMRGELPTDWERSLAGLVPADGKPVATRVISGKTLNAAAKRVEALVGGSADLTGSVGAEIKGDGFFGHDAPDGRNLRFGVREHAMAAIAGGMAVHGGVIPYVGTFFVFSDYMRPSIRLAALMGARVIYLFSHDSIGLGEDGPTHQPVEQLMALRLIPRLSIIRPADAAETVEAWRAALQRADGPTALVLTRQGIPVLDRRKYAAADGLHRGGYVLWQSSDGKPDVILIGTGSETSLALEAGQTLAGEGVNARVVSLPSWDLFERQEAAYRESVLPNDVRARVAVEAGLARGWERYVGLDGAVVGLDDFGASAPYTTLYAQFGIAADAVIARAKELLAKGGRKRAAKERL